MVMIDFELVWMRMLLVILFMLFEDCSLGIIFIVFYIGMYRFIFLYVVLYYYWYMIVFLKFIF